MGSLIFTCFALPQAASRQLGMGLSAAAALRTHLAVQRLVGLLQVRKNNGHIGVELYLTSSLHTIPYLTFMCEI
jgi:hypothetical protein